MLKTNYLTLLGLLYAIALYAQPQPCGPKPEMTSFCDEACIICDINGFTGINDDPIVGQAPPGFCTSTVHHMQWIGFIAGTPNLTLNLKVFGCKTGDGLEVGIYKSLDCTKFELVSNCDGDIQQGETGVFKNTVPLTVGQYYYFVMDGNHGDVCQYTITVVDGSTAVGELPYSGILTGDATVCPGRTEPYVLDPPSGAAWFTWTLDGAPLHAGVDTSVTINWTMPGYHQLCATSSNVCDTAPPVCQLIQVQPIPPTNLLINLCEGECWQGADTVICDAGLYQFHFDGQEGCDSTVTVQVNVLPTAQTDLDLLMCKGDTIRIGSKPFYESGQYQEVLTNQVGCDSTVNLTLKVIVCEIKGVLTPEAVGCNGQATGALHFMVKDGTPPFHYTWERIGPGQPSGKGDFNAVNSEVLVPKLPQGTYFITITDDYGHDLVLFDDITEPLPLSAEFSRPDFQGFQVSCAKGADGWLEILPAGGRPPYTYQWNNGLSEARIAGLTAGTYTCTLSDSKGCVDVFSASLTEPPALQLEAVFTQPGCAGYNSGAAAVMLSAGGVPPYQYALSGSGFSTKSTYKNLWYGPYTLTLRDTNGCTVDTTVTLAKPLIPDIILSPDVTINLAESTPLYLLANVALDSILWSPPLGLSCTNCPRPDATPYSTTTYTATVISAVNGCTDTDSLTVVVREKRDVYIPNTFSPNDDGKNDFFTVFGGPEVQEVQSLEVWSRWGELVFEGRHFKPNEEALGWNGSFRSKQLPPGVYVWRAVVGFVDGVVLTYQGDVTTVR